MAEVIWAKTGGRWSTSRERGREREKVRSSRVGWTCSGRGREKRNKLTKAGMEDKRSRRSGRNGREKPAWDELGRKAEEDSEWAEEKKQGTERGEKKGRSSQVRFRGNEKGAGSEGNISDLEREEGYCRIEEGTRSYSHTHISLALALTLAVQGGTTLPPQREQCNLPYHGGLPTCRKDGRTWARSHGRGQPIRWDHGMEGTVGPV
ncbi:uncharacterized protein CLUP02_17421 [Colletotrichum lupini]|uniref:Uncharacterized protein n=1 Tax=Colletotrichum lupini TaxID=145971 RepID=A0A9Q8SEH4_9PEZI|nr:uncharacterized protein CLUP02_17421 [Colletotrichum lupini]KAK1713146.1 hypothetical protein BDP67DRAFT_48190 [Colletotrichum lupini]UQC75912.1 hypothetical protein CLUP02_17421 [Colletotrichum lupini]